MADTVLFYKVAKIEAVITADGIEIVILMVRDV